MISLAVVAYLLVKSFKKVSLVKKELRGPTYFVIPVIVLYGLQFVLFMTIIEEVFRFSFMCMGI